jgi:transcriptional regulator with XRE-family HTH domain
MVTWTDHPVQEVATAVGVSTRTLSDWMSGRRLPTPPQQATLAQYFGVDRDFLFGAEQ